MRDMSGSCGTNCGNGSSGPSWTMIFWSPEISGAGRSIELIRKFDYFILVLSRDLLRQAETYVYHELRTSPERDRAAFNRESSSSCRYVLTIAPSPAYLGDLHVGTVDMRENTGLDALVQTIKTRFSTEKAITP